MKPLLDKILAFTVSKKLSVFIIACFMLLKDKITGTEWIDIAMIYIGGQVIIDSIIKLRESLK